MRGIPCWSLVSLDRYLTESEVVQWDEEVRRIKREAVYEYDCGEAKRQELGSADIQNLWKKRM